MHALPLYYLARLRSDEIDRVARQSARWVEPQGSELTDVPDQHRRWRVRWNRMPHPAL
ncbi:MAG: hypothetical protein ACRDPJ_22500 [Nocardioidaceae bacterium]